MKLHPAVQNLLPLFEYDHLKNELRDTSKMCHDLAHKMVSVFEGEGTELTVGLRKLLEAKDCFVRQIVLNRKKGETPK